MNHTFIILKYLYNNNDGHYRDVREAYNDNNKPSDVLIYNKIIELANLGLIDSRSVYDDRGILDIPFNEQIVTMEATKPASYQVMITAQGEDYIDERIVKVFKWIVKKNDFFIVSITAIVILITTIINVIINLLFK